MWPKCVYYGEIFSVQAGSNRNCIWFLKKPAEIGVSAVFIFVVLYIFYKYVFITSMYKFKFLIFEETIMKHMLCPLIFYWRTQGSRRRKRSPYTACSIIMNIRQPLPFWLLMPLIWQASQWCPELQMCSFSIVCAAWASLRSTLSSPALWYYP